MRRIQAWHAAAIAALSACLEVPPHQPCGPRDLDCDGWPAVATTPAANDCDDRDPAINPGADDDPTTTVDEDCLAGGSGQVLAGVSGGAAQWVSGDLRIGFDTPTKMPSSVEIGGLEVLATDTSACLIANEEGMGLSLYPAFAAHARSPTPPGTLTLERRGPVLATSRVEWTADVPAGAVGDRCDVATTLTASVRFTVLPGGRLVREDLVTVSSPVAMCAGCASVVTPPLFTSYVTLDASFDRLAINDGPESPFPATATPQLPSDRVCLRQSGGRAAVAMTWRSEVGAAGIRLRPTGDGSAAAVFDWRRSAPVPAGTYRAITAMFVESTAPGGCSEGLREAIAELASPPQLMGLAFAPSLGIYEPTTTPTGSLSFQAIGAIHRGFAVRSAGLGDRGVTVWRRSAAGVLGRLRRGEDYLIQRDDDGAYVVYLTGVEPDQQIIVAGPGSEPGP